MLQIARDRETVSQKAGRLVDNYQVFLTSPTDGIVIGDHGTYRLNTLGKGSCTCKWMLYQGWKKPCSHILAARKAAQQSDRPVPTAMLLGALAAVEDDPFKFR